MSSTLQTVAASHVGHSVEEINSIIDAAKSAKEISNLSNTLSPEINLASDTFDVFAETTDDIYDFSDAMNEINDIADSSFSFDEMANSIGNIGESLDSASGWSDAFLDFYDIADGASDMADEVSDAMDTVSDVSNISENVAETTSLLSKLSKGAKNAGSVLESLGNSIGDALSASFEALATVLREGLSGLLAIAPATLVIGAAVGVVAAVFHRASEAAHAYENAVNDVETAQNAYEETSAELDSVNEELETTSARIDELKAKGTLTLTEQAELTQLQSQNAELERKAALLERVADAQRRSATNEAMDALNISGSQSKYSKEHAAELDGAVDYTTELKAAKEDLKYLRELYAERELLQLQLESAAASNDKSSYDTFSNQLAETDKEITEYTASLGDQVAQFQEFKDILEQDTNLGEVEGGEKMLSDLTKFINEFSNVGTNLTPMQDALSKIQTFFDGSTDKNAFSDQILSMVKAGDTATDALNKLGVSLSDLDLDKSQGQYLNQYFNDLAASATEASEAIAEVDGTMDGVAAAFESENSGAQFESLSDYLTKAKDLYDRGLKGTDDFKSVAKLISKDGSTLENAVENFSDNYQNIKRYFTEDKEGNLTKTGINRFVSDLEATGKTFKTTAEAADALGISTEAFEIIMARLGDYDITQYGDNTFDSMVKSAEAFDNAKTELQKLQEVYDSMSDSDPRKSKLKQMLDDWGSQIDAAENDLDSLDTDIVLQMKLEYDLQSLQNQIDQARKVAQYSGDSVSYGTSIALQESYNKQLASSMGWDREGIKLPVSLTTANDAYAKLVKDLQAAAASGNTELVAELQPKVDNVGALIGQISDAFHSAHPEVTADMDVETANATMEKWLAEEGGQEILAKITADNEEALQAIADILDIDIDDLKVKISAEDNTTDGVNSAKDNVNSVEQDEPANIEAEDKTSPAVEAAATALASLTGYDKDFVLSMIADDKASPYLIDVISTITNIPSDVLVQINAQDGASGIIQYLRDHIDELPEEVQTILRADDKTGGAIDSAVAGVENLEDKASDSIEFTLDVNDQASTDIAQVLSDLTGIPLELLIQMIASNEATPEIISVMSALSGIPEEELTKINATDGASGVIASVLAAATGLSVPQVVQLLASDGASAVIEKVDSKKLDTKTAQLKAKDNASKIVKSVNNLKIKDKSFVVKAIDRASGVISNIRSWLSGLTNKTVTLTTIRKVVNTSVGTQGNVTHFLGGHASGTAHTLGTTNQSGTSYANGKRRGDWSVGANQEALVNEVAPEIIVRDGKWFIANNGQPGFVRLKKDDIVFNGSQTRELLNSGKASSYGKFIGALNSGSAYSSGTIGGKAYASGSSNSNKNTIDWIEIALDRLEAIAKKYSTRMENTFNNFNTRMKEWNNTTYDTKLELEKQRIAYKEYLAAADKVNLSANLKKQVREGAYYVYDGYSEKEKEAFDQYKELYDKAMDAQQAIEELTVSLGELYKQAFDIVQERYENEFNALEGHASHISNNIDLAEAKGYFANAKDYESLVSFEQRKRAKGEEEYRALVEKLNAAVASGTVAKWSDEWWEMYNATLEVASGIQEADIALAEFQQNLNDLKWDNFDYLEDRISQLTSEADFLIELFDEDKLLDENGNLTNEGWSVVGLHNQNYLTYMQQVEDYKNAIHELDAELASDKGNQNLIERREDLLKAEQDAILAAKGEKDAIKDLVSNAYNDLSDSIGDVVGAYEDALDAAKDLYDYQKNISQATKNISALQKQLLAYENDTSEENKARVQKIRLELEEAQADLADTEYEHYISSTKELLDDLQDELEKVFNERIDDIDALLESTINGIDQNSSVISSTIQETAAAYGYEMTNNTAEILNGTGSQLQNVTSVLSEIKSYVAAIQSQTQAVRLDSNGDPILDSNGNVQTGDDDMTMAVEYSKPATSSTTTKPTTTTQTTTKPTTTTSQNNTSNIFKYKKYTGNKSKLDKNNSIVDRLKYFDFDSSFSARKGYYSALGLSGTYNGSSSQNVAMLNKMKSMGYSSGGFVADMQKIAFRNGDDMIAVNTLKKGEAVLSAAQTEMFKALIEKLPTANAMLDTSQFFPNLSGNFAKREIGNVENKTEINVAIDRVLDYNDFVSQMQKDPRVERIIQGMTVDQLAGKGALSKYRVK